MSSYSFSVAIDPADASILAKNGYSLAVAKSTTQNPPAQYPVQWLSTPVIGNNYVISWTEQYQVYYTNTFVQNGATIYESDATAINLGNEYSFSPATWTQISPSNVGVGSVQVDNQLSAPSNYGIAQAFTDPSTGESVFSPIAVATGVFKGGHALFTPTETITVYFSQTPGNGIINSVVTASYTFSATSGITTKLQFKNQQWSKLSSVSALENATPSLSNLWSYLIKFSGFVNSAVALSFIRQYLTKSGEYHVHSESPSGDKLAIQVYGRSSPAKLVESLVGKSIPDIYKTPVAPQTWKISGLEVTILQVIPLYTQDTILWNALHDLAKKD